MKIFEIKLCEGNPENLIIGMDEAGRGPAIGPLMIGMAIIPAQKLYSLNDLKVQDSKVLKRNIRDEIALKLKEELTSYGVLEIPAKYIDMQRSKEITLNQIEIHGFRHLLSSANYQSSSCTLQLDAADVNEERFGNNFSDMVQGKIESKHKGDSLFPAVAAASILAKSARDMRMDEINIEMKNYDHSLPEIGSGYPNAKTKHFLAMYYKKYREYPDIVRKSWQTSIQIREELSIHLSSLDDFF